MRTPGPQQATFVIRFRRERRANSAWLAEVEYVQRGEKLVAGDPSSAMAHVTAWLEALAPEEQ